MSETKWTPGPWKAYELDPDDPAWEACEIWPTENDRDQEDGLTSPVATMVCGVANASLISAAPELYYALERVLQTIVKHAGPKDAAPGTPIHEARAALAKARGEQP